MIFISLVTLTYCVLYGNYVTGLKWVKVAVPEVQTPGERTILKCDYDLGNDTLYAVKWYKDGEEFYRFVRKARPPERSFPVIGIHVDLNSSNSTRVVLNSVSVKTSGLFRCEVSAEKPNFFSKEAEARMVVLSAPKEKPEIIGVKVDYVYQIGDEIELNCTSGSSHPAQVLHWYVNGEKVTEETSLVYYHPTVYEDGLISVTLGLKFTISSFHFRDGQMIVKCTATLMADDKKIVVQNLPIKDLRETSLSLKMSDSSKLSRPGLATLLCLTSSLLLLTFSFQF